MYCFLRDILFICQLHISLSRSAQISLELLFCVELHAKQALLKKPLTGVKLAAPIPQNHSDSVTYTVLRDSINLQAKCAVHRDQAPSSLIRLLRGWIKQCGAMFNHCCFAECQAQCGKCGTKTADCQCKCKPGWTGVACNGQISIDTYTCIGAYSAHQQGRI